VKERSSGHVKAIVAKRDGQNRMLTGRQLFVFIKNVVIYELV
jgi:hypothetical protein